MEDLTTAESIFNKLRDIAYEEMKNPENQVLTLANIMEATTHLLAGCIANASQGKADITPLYLEACRVLKESIEYQKSLLFPEN